MKMIKIVFIFSFCYFFLTGSSYVFAAERPVSAVVLSFADATQYETMQANTEIMESVLLNELIMLPELSLMERTVINEPLAVEEKLKKPLGNVSAVVENADFKTAFEAAENDVSSKSIGEKISPVTTRMIGEKYHVDYLIHGSIDYMQMSKKQTCLPMKHSVVDITNPYLETLVTVTLIKANTGEVVWRTQEKAVSKESLWAYKDAKRSAKIGSGKFNDTLFSKALEKVGIKIVKALREDLMDKKLIL